MLFAAATSPAAAFGFAGAALGTGAVLDLQPLALVGLMPCGGEPPVGALRYLLSPFADMGPVAVSAGNVGLIAGASLLHFLVVELARLSRRLRWTGAMVAAWFPAASLLVLFLLTAGTLQAAFSLLWTFRAGGAAAGAVAALCVVGAVALCTWAGAHLLPEFAFEPYPDAVLPRRWLLRALLPCGRWAPDACRQQYGPLLAAVHGRRRCLAMQAEWYAVALALATSVDARPSHCALQYAAVSALAWASAAVYAIARPCRAAAVNVLNVVSLCAFGASTAASALGARGAVLGPSAAAGVASAMGLVMMGVSVLRFAQLVLQSYFEQVVVPRRASVAGLVVGVLTSLLALLSGSSTGQDVVQTRSDTRVRSPVAGDGLTITSPASPRAARRALRELVRLVCALSPRKGRHNNN
jgi:hypothetical protein